MPMHELIQSYLDTLYRPLETEIKQAMLSNGNEQYGYIHYYSFLKLMSHLNISSQDHFLDIGSGFGKLIFQVFLTSELASATGIEIQFQRHQIADQINRIIQKDLPLLFKPDRNLSFFQGDFLGLSSSILGKISIIYVCASVFSPDLILAIGKKINDMKNVHTILSFRKIPNLEHLKIEKKIFVECSWDSVACYFYRRNYYE
jgi:Histone methylation protein DOT1